MAQLTARKVLLVGWDGADWLILEPLLAAGRLPTLKRLIDRGVAGDLRSQEPLLSPLLWTTIATGKPVAQHGVSDFLVRDARGELTPIGASARRVHALWSLLPAFGLSADVVAWWATWPAEPTGGTMVSDRVAYQLFGLGATTIPDGKVHPPAEWDAVERRLVGAEDIGWNEARRFVAIDEADYHRRWNAVPAERRQEDRVNHLRKVLAATRSYHRVALDLLADQADLTMVYYEGTDTVGHLFGRFLPPALPGVAEDDVRRFGAALPEFYEYADELLGELLGRVDETTVVLLVSDHGFFTGAARPAVDPSDFTSGAPAWHRLHGIIVAAGAGIDRRRIEGATIFDVMPTVLAVLGLPLPADLPGQVLRAVTPRGVEPLRPPELASYEGLRGLGTALAPAQRAASPEDRERVRELAALGYLSPWRVAEATTNGDEVATAAYNRGRIAQRNGDLESARREFEHAVGQQPSFGSAWAALAQVADLEGQHCAAFEILVRGFTKSRTMPVAGLTGLVDEARRCGRLADAEWVLDRLRPAYERQSAYHAALGALRAAQGRRGEALARYREALARDPLDALAIEESVSILARSGREAEARALLAQSESSARGQLAAMNQVALVAMRAGWTAEAERLWREILASDPGNPGVLANLAATLSRAGRAGDAIATMREAVARDPENASNRFNLGSMLADQDQPAVALFEFESALRLGLTRPDVYVASAKMRFRLDDRARARSDLEQALRLDPGHREAAAMLARLAAG
jgi:Tfp pilus assembly protein PilF